MLENCGTTEETLSKLREYARDRIAGVWHYPDDREPCPYCGTSSGLQVVRHRPPYGVRGYLGTGPVTIVSDTPSGDVHFKSDQAKLYYANLKAHGLDNAFLTDLFNTRSVRDDDMQQALFLIQIEIVRPVAMLVMVPPERLQPHLRADGFDFELEKTDPRVGRVVCGSGMGPEFSFDVYRISHYTILRRDRTGWEKKFRETLSSIPELKRAPLKADSFVEPREGSD